MEETKTQQKSKKYKKVLVFGLAILLVGVIGTSGWFYLHRNTSPVPKNISQSVSFPIYYPDQKKLPTGYTLNINSFKTPQKDAVLYTITYENNRKVTFSLQPKISYDDLQTFYANYIPLRNELQTAVGKAEIGAYNNHGKLQTLVSLPTNDRTWLIISAPADIDQDKLKEILNSIRQ